MPKKPAARLDDVDLRILQVLQKDATLSSSQVAEAVGVSQSPAWRRMTALQDQGVIRARVALLDRAALGLELMIFVLVRLKDQTSETVEEFRNAVVAMEEVVQAHLLMGDIDFMLVVVAKDLDAFNRVVRNRIARLPGVTGIDSRLVVEEAKNTTELPLR